MISVEPREIYAKRLLKLAGFLRRLPWHRFDFGRWVGSGWEGKPDLSCGTRACAMGWAATIPEFRELGLRLFYRPDGEHHIGLEGRDCNVFHAAAHVFGVTMEEFEDVFVRGSATEAHKVGAGNVAIRIEQLVYGWGWCATGERRHTCDPKGDGDSSCPGCIDQSPPLHGTVQNDDAGSGKGE